jgi:hypothetical protein
MYVCAIKIKKDMTNTKRVQYLVTYEGQAACLVNKNELIHILAFMMSEFTDPEKKQKKDFSLTIKSVTDGHDN